MGGLFSGAGVQVANDCLPGGVVHVWESECGCCLDHGGGSPVQHCFLVALIIDKDELPQSFHVINLSIISNALRRPLSITSQHPRQGLPAPGDQIPHPQGTPESRRQERAGQNTTKSQVAHRHSLLARRNLQPTQLQRLRRLPSGKDHRRPQEH